MKGRLGGIFIESLKIASATWGVIWVDPWMAETFPTFPIGVRYLLAAIFAAVIVEALAQLVLGWPYIGIHWKDSGRESPITEVCATFRHAGPHSQVFLLDISSESNGLLGRYILNLITRSGTELHIKIIAAAVVPTCEASSMSVGEPEGEDVATIKAERGYGGFKVLLGEPPRRAGAWHFAKVRWEDRSTNHDTEFNIEYVLHHPSSKFKTFLFQLVRISSNAKHFRVVGI